MAGPTVKGFMRTWRDALEALDLEQAALVQALTGDPTKSVAELARATGRHPRDGDRILGEALTHLGRRFTDQARAATDGRRR